MSKRQQSGRDSTDDRKSVYVGDNICEIFRGVYVLFTASQNLSDVSVFVHRATLTELEHGVQETKRGGDIFLFGCTRNDVIFCHRTRDIRSKMIH